MTVYWVSTTSEIRDPQRLQRYAELAGPALEAGGGRFLARGTPVATFEGAGDARTVVLEFADLAAARAAYDSAAYQEALTALGDAVTRQVRIVPAVGS